VGYLLWIISQPQLLREIHAAVMNELDYIKKRQEAARQIIWYNYLNIY